ncbi:MAG: DNA adenine methylase [Williamsia sp.]|nr:DNA adenine methylase [Williamsia sp.]
MATLPSERPFPSTRYYGSKRRLLGWIQESLSGLRFNSVLDAFGGTASVSLLFKQQGKKVHYNDLLCFNQFIGTALIENAHTLVTETDLQQVLTTPLPDPQQTIQQLYKGVFYLDEENRWLDDFIQKVFLLGDKYKQAILLAALFQACLSKRPFNLFHRANLNLRTRDVKRSFGNKKTWDRPFEELIRKFIREYNRAVYDNGKENRVVGGYNALDCPNGVDLVYLDPPYFHDHHSTGLNYQDYYGFLEGIANYRDWPELVAHTGRALPKVKENEGIKDFTSKETISAAMEKLIDRFQDNIIVLSYLDQGIPDPAAIVSLFRKYGKRVKLHRKQHQYALSPQTRQELLFVAR